MLAGEVTDDGSPDALHDEEKLQGYGLPGFAHPKLSQGQRSA